MSRKQKSRRRCCMATAQLKKKSLNPEMRSPLVQAFEAGMRARIVGQEAAVAAITSLYQVFQADISCATRPVGTLLFLGPTGSGKTRVVEAAAEVLFGHAGAVVKIDCAEFQHSHEISKLIGSPPGYLGHRETTPLLTQENLDKHHTERNNFSLVLFDEIEKASDALWQLLLGVLDKATLTLGDNKRVNFARTMIFLTSNLGAKEMSDLISGSLGFAPARVKSEVPGLDKNIQRTAVEAAKRRFSPEFMNRLDKTVVFRSLKQDDLYHILHLELNAVQDRIEKSQRARFSFSLDDEAKKFLLDEGTNAQYGARHLKRAIEKHVVYPFANLISTGQLRTGDRLSVGFDEVQQELTFSFLESEQQSFDSLLPPPTGPRKRLAA